MLSIVTQQKLKVKRKFMKNKANIWLHIKCKSSIIKEKRGR